MIICDHFSREAFKGLGVCLGATFSGRRHSAHSVPRYAGSKEKNYFFLTFAVRRLGSYERYEAYAGHNTCHTCHAMATGRQGNIPISA